MKINKLYWIGIFFLIVCSINVLGINYDYARGLEDTNNVWIKINITSGTPLQITISNTSGYVSTPNNVFLLYDDFDGASLNNTKWGNASGIVQLSGVVNISGNGNANLIYSNVGWQMSDSSNLGIFMLARGMGANAGYTQMELSVGNTISASATGTNGSGIFLSHDAGTDLNNIYANWNAYGETGNSGWTASSVSAGELNLMGIWLRGNNASHYRGTSYSYNKTTANKYGGLMKAKMGYAGSYDWVEVMYRNHVEPTIACGANVCNITSTVTLTDYQVVLTTTLGGDLVVSTPVNLITYSLYTPLNTTFNRNTTPATAFNVTSITGTWNISSIFNTTRGCTVTGVNTVGLWNCTSTALTAGGEYTWYGNATESTVPTNYLATTETRQILIAGGTGGITTKTCSFPAGSIAISSATGCY